MIVKYIGCNTEQGSSDKFLRSFLLLSKQCHLMMRRQVLKQALVYEIDSVNLNRKRVYIWKRLLGMDKDKKDYYAFRDKVNSVN